MIADGIVTPQLYEGQSEVAEMREEAEMLRLKLEAAEQEAAEAKQAAIQAQSALAEALAAATPSPTSEQPATDVSLVLPSSMKSYKSSATVCQYSPVLLRERTGSLHRDSVSA